MLSKKKNIRGLSERKYALPRLKRNRLISLLRHKTVIPEEHPTSQTRTIYFDTKSNYSYLESRDGYINKTKYRFREYLGITNGATYSLEIKFKKNHAISKIKELIYEKLPEHYRIITFSHLVTDLEEQLNTSYLHLKAELPTTDLYPDIIISYKRLRFLDKYTETRYNVDTDIKVMKWNRGKETFWQPLDYDIFEVKSRLSEYYPDFLRELGLLPNVYSKFVQGKNKLGEEI